MLGALVLIMIQLLLLKKITTPNFKFNFINYIKNNKLLALSIVLLIIQIVMGTQVRQQVDHFLEIGVSRENIASQFDVIFYIHRSFSIVLLLIIGIHLLNLFKTEKRGLFYLVGSTLVLEILIGMFLSYLGMQAIGQPFHLFLSLLLFGLLVQSSLKKTIKHDH